MIVHTSYVTPVRIVRRRGLGQDPYQQWVQSLPAICWQNSDPSSGVIIGTAAPECMTPASVLQATAALPEHQPSPENYVNPTVTATANNPTFITATVNDAPMLTAYTANLEGHLAEAVTNAMADAATLASIGDPTSYLTGIANQYCVLYGGAATQCSNQSALIAQYANELQTAINQHATAVQKEIASYGSGVAPNYPAYSTGYVAPSGSSSGSSVQGNKQTSISKSQSTSALTPARYKPVVVNPSPASQSTTTGSSLTSPGSVSSVANGGSLQTGSGTATTSTDIIPGVPNEALFIGGSALAVILIAMVAK